jgi:flagellar FliJ protein
MPFQFRLAPLITIRDNVLKEKQGELAKAYEARRIVEEKLYKIEQELNENQELGRRIVQSGNIRVDYLLGLRRQEMFLKAEQADMIQKRQMIDEEIERRRTEVIEADKNLKIIEKLKEKRYEKYQTEENRKETIMMDEIANRKKGNG